MVSRWNRPRFPLVAVLPVLAIALCTSTSALAEAPIVEVQVASGRTFRGAVDPSSTSEQLVLRSGEEGVTIRRPIRWDRVRSAIDAAGETLAVSELRMQAAGRAVQPLTASESIPAVIRLPAVQQVAEPVEPIFVLPVAQPVSITFDVRVANWDGDVESDGLLVDFAPLDAAGNVTLASGTLQVELLAPQRRAFHHAPRSGGDTLEVVERWYRTVHAADFGPHGVRLKLPFGAVHPEFDEDWFAWHYGLVHVRFAAAGSGVLEDSIDGVRLRPWAPNRDQLELNEGRRFWPTEGVGRRD